MRACSQFMPERLGAGKPPRANHIGSADISSCVSNISCDGTEHIVSVGHIEFASANI